MGLVKTIAKILVVVGGLNWGLVGLFSLDVVAAIFGEASAISRIIYVLVGISAIIILFPGKKTAVRSQAQM